MRAIKVAFSTMGQSSPATVAEDAGRNAGYRWRGIPGWQPGFDPDADTTPSQDSHRQGRLERIAKFEKHYGLLRRDGWSKRPAILEAGRRVGVGEATAYEYERHVRDEQS